MPSGWPVILNPTVVDCHKFAAMTIAARLAKSAQHWGALRPLVQQLPSIDQGLLGSIDSHLGELGGPSFNLPGVGYGGGPGIGFDPRSFVSLAAAVEGGTLSIRRDIDRIDGRIRSSTYRRQITEAVTGVVPPRRTVARRVDRIAS